ncbi:MAG: glucose 1-dehydrogenase [Bifidobacteriaceae bacterium]|jgi:NAD(P)-dependent dehydrogenase (short-subunit alcohol dehydrogenase family)|nr:glucose 1-dehydrogenase [Bifidobacteriaceae bacterium]
MAELERTGERTGERPGELTGEVALITGAGQGIGEVVAARFVRAGAAVVVLDVNGRAAESVAARIGHAIAVEADVTSESDLERAWAAAREAFSDVSIVVNNAITCCDADFLDISRAEWSRDIAVTLTGAFLTAKLALPAMIAAGRGVIINMSSVNALSYFGNESYSAAKAGLLSLTRSLAVRFGPDGIRANAIVPGTIVTPVWDHRISADPDVLDKALAWYPSTRLGRSEDVAEAALYLASDRAAWVNGVALPVDGGLLAGNIRLARDIVPEQ